MSRPPIEVLLDRVTWTALPPHEEPGGLPYATHEGVLDIGGLALRVYQLSNGVRVIDEESMVRFLEGLAG